MKTKTKKQYTNLFNGLIKGLEQDIKNAESALDKSFFQFLIKEYKKDLKAVYQKPLR